MSESEQRPSEGERLLHHMLSAHPPPGLEDRVLRRLAEVERGPVAPPRASSGSPARYRTSWRPRWAMVFAFSVLAGIVVAISLPKHVTVAPGSRVAGDTNRPRGELVVRSPASTSSETGSTRTSATVTARRGVKPRLAIAHAPVEPLLSFQTADEQPLTNTDASVPGTPLPAFEQAMIPGQPLPKIENGGVPGHVLPQFTGAVVPGTPLPTFAQATNTGDRP